MRLVKIKDAQGEIKILNIEAITRVWFSSHEDSIFISTGDSSGVRIERNQWNLLVEKVFNGRIAPEIRDITTP